MITQTLEQMLLSDTAIVELLETMEHNGPADAYIAAGLIRNHVWDRHYRCISDHTGADVDVVYFDTTDPRRESESRYEKALRIALPGYHWQVRNQARMHVPAGDAPYAGVADALAHWPETATAVAVRLSGTALEVVAPFGTHDLMAHILRPTPAILARDITIFHNRVRQKGWLKRWPDLVLARP